jgi:hypothetical protein
MKPVPGTLQEGGAPFHTTHWTVILLANKADADEAARKALATFSDAYWPPLYTFVRRRGYSPADAQDIVHGFLVHLFEQKTLSRADREKGRLRTFLLGSLQHPRIQGLSPATGEPVALGQELRHKRPDRGY